MAEMVAEGTASNDQTGADEPVPAWHPSVSIIIPHLNQNADLDRCLKRLAEQSFAVDRIEILVVDNGSNVVPTLSDDWPPHVTLLVEPEPGAGPARNRGMAAAKGDTLLFLDADCFPQTDWVEIAVEALQQHETPVILGGDVKVPTPEADEMTPLIAYEIVFTFRMREMVERDGYAGTGNMATKRETAERIGPFSTIDVAEDADWGQRANDLGIQIAFQPDLLVFHPARSSFHDLYGKWERHSRHEYLHRRRQSAFWAGLLVFRAILILAATVPHISKILQCDQLQGWRANWLAFLGLLRVRWFRARTLVALAVSPRFRNQEITWNR